MEIGKQISNYRKEKHITQEQLGNAVGVTNRTVSKWEQGVSMPGIDLAPRIASALNVSLDQLFDIETKEEENELFQIVKKALSEIIEDELYGTISDALEELLPQYISNCSSSDEYSLLILSREKSTTCLFKGQGSVQGPFNNNRYCISIPMPGGNVTIVGYYDSKEEASDALESIFKAYSQRLAKIELK